MSVIYSKKGERSDDFDNFLLEKFNVLLKRKKKLLKGENNNEV